MPFPTAAQRRLHHLYHWQRFQPDRLEKLLRDNTIYCSKPSDFNDPWDCRPFFNTEILDDKDEREKHIEWAVKVCRQAGMMAEAEIENMQRRLRADRALLQEKIGETTLEMQQAIMDRYRVFCLCPDVQNPLMWAHYADNHRGICLEFNVRNETICCALEVQYFERFPMTRQYSDDLSENLLPLLAKSAAWAYESEFRLIAQVAGNATAHETLLAENGQLRLAAGALKAIIVGCQGPVADVKATVAASGSKVPVMRARRVENEYAFAIEPSG